MDISEFVGYDPDDTLVDSETWETLFEDWMSGDPAAAEILGRVMLLIREAIESGPEGNAKAINTVTESMHQMFVHTETFKAARSLWILSLDGRITPQNEPEEVLTAAIERGLKETVGARRRSASRKARMKNRRTRSKEGPGGGSPGIERESGG